MWKKWRSRYYWFYCIFGADKWNIFYDIWVVKDFFSPSCRFIKGFMNRNQPVSMDNSDYLAFVRQSYLTRLKDNLPKSVLDKTIWLTPPPIMQEVFHILFNPLLLKPRKVLFYSWKWFFTVMKIYFVII